MGRVLIKFEILNNIKKLFATLLWKANEQRIKKHTKYYINKINEK